MLGLLGGLFGGLGNMVNGIIEQNMHQEDMYQKEMDRYQAQEMLNQQIEYAREAKDWDVWMNEQNINAQDAINQRNLANQNELNRIMRQREDTAVRRRMQDLKAAGINPLLAGVQGAGAAPGNMTTLTAPVMDTSIGSRYAANVQGAYSDYGKNLREIAAEAGRSNERRANAMARATEGVQQAFRDISEQKLMKAKVSETNANTNNIIANTLKTTEETKEVSDRILTNQKQREVLEQTILTEPTKRALLTAQTTAQYKNIEQITQNIKNAIEEQRTEIMKQTEILKTIDLTKEQTEKIKAETTKLLLEGDMQEFENNMKEITKSVGLSKSLVEMFTDVVRTLTLRKGR